MGKTPDEIANDVDQTRNDLRSNLQELELRVRDATNWRTQVRRHPGRAFGAAVVGGALLALMMGRH